MKEIPNKKFNEQDTTASMLLTCLNSVPAQGFTLADIRARNKVSAVCEAAKKSTPVLKFEDADYAVAQAAVKETRWLSLGKHIAEFGALFGV